MLFLKWESCLIFLNSTMKNKWLYSCICKNYKRFLAFLNCVVDLKDSLCHFVLGGACVWWLYEGHSVWPLCLQSASPHRHHICVGGGKCGALCHREGKLVYSQQFKILSYPGYSFVKETCIFPLGVELLVRSMKNLNLKRVMCPFYSIVSLVWIGTMYNCPSIVNQDMSVNFLV